MERRRITRSGIAIRQRAALEPLRYWALVEYRDGSRRFEGVVRNDEWLDEPGGAEFPESRPGHAAVGYVPPPALHELKGLVEVAA